MKRNRAVSNVGFQLVPKRKGDPREYAPVKTLTEDEMRELGYKIKEKESER